MKLAVCSITHHSVHSPEMLIRHNLDWRLQTDQRFHLFINHDGLVEGREDRVSIEDLDYGDKTTFVTYPERRRFWGAYCRRDWLYNLSCDEFSHVYFCCADDMIGPHFVETMLKATEEGRIPLVMAPIIHHHYSDQPIPMGTWPTVNRADWASGIIDIHVAKRAFINHPEDFAADGLFWQDCFSSLNHDELKLKIIPNILVFKN